MGTQAEIDIQSGLLHSINKNFKAYSFYYEAFERLSSNDDPRTLSCLKYTLLCKILSGHAAQVCTIIQSKMKRKYSGEEVDSIKALAKVCQIRSLSAFQDCLMSYKTQLVADPHVSTHLGSLY